jgi:hypothetical protein
MPPATTRRFPERPSSTSRDARIAPPFVPAQAAPEPEATPSVEPEASAANEPFESQLDAEPAFEAAPEPEEPQDEWDVLSDEGVVEPAFEADTDAVLQELTEQAAELSLREDFPLEAFIVPEQTQHVPSGLEGRPSTEPEPTPVSSLAERLEKLSHRLRVEETDAIVRRLAAGDRLDSLLAGLLAGYLAGKSEQR